MSAGVGAGFALLCVIGVGCLVARFALHAAGLRGRRRDLHTAAFGPGLGLGIASLLTFLCRTFGLPRPGLLAFLAAGALLAAISAWRRRPPRAVLEQTPPPRRPRPPFFVRIAALLMLLISCLLLLETFRAVSRAWPEGTWDAVAIWNARARLLDRGYDRAPEILKELEPYGHPNYPLLVPGAVAAQSEIAGVEDPWVPRLTGLAFTVGIGLLVLAVVADAGSLPLAAMAAALVVGNPMLLKWSGSQCADIPVAYYLLGAVAVLASRLPGRRDEPLPLALGGAFLGFLAWTKNEGVVMLLIVAGLYGLWKLLGRQHRGLGREALAFASGALPGLLAVFLFKRLWAPESGLQTFFRGDALERVTSLERWWTPVREVVQRLAPVRDGFGWSPVWPLLLAGVGLAVWAQLRVRRPWASFWGACLLATVGSWIPIFAVTPYAQMWHISGSLDRLYLQVFPALVAGLFLRLSMALGEKVRGPARVRSVSVPAGLWLAGALGLSLAVKTYVTATYLPRIWLFWDELFYTMTAYDIAHWGERGVPHPDAFFYPPLTSLVIAPFYALGIHPPLIYHIGLLLFGVMLSSAVVAAALLLRRLFGTDSRLMAAVLVLGPPAYTALLLMSEPLFVALYTWFLYFLVRMLQDGRPRDAWAAGLLLAGLVLTRFTGYLVAMSLVLGGAVAAWEALRTRDRRTVWLHARALIPAAVAFLVWRRIAPHVKTAAPMDDPLVLLAATVNFPLELALGAARRFFAEIGYVSLSTFGVALPAALWLLFRPRPRDRTVRLFLLHLLSFLATACALAAVFMWFGAIRSPLPRFDLYGRYVDYFAIPLFVAAFGALVRLREPGSVGSRVALAAGALILNAALLLFIPERFYVGSLEQNQVAPNSLGIAWLFALVAGLGTGGRWLAPVLAALLLWGLTSRGRVRHAAAAALVFLAVANFGLAVRATSIQSFGSATYGSVLSDYVTAHPEAFAGGLYVDYPEYLREDGPVGDYATVYRVMADHPGKVIAGREPGPYVGKMPVLTWRRLDRPVLAEWPHLTYRIYAADP